MTTQMRQPQQLTPEQVAKLRAENIRTFGSTRTAVPAPR